MTRATSAAIFLVVGLLLPGCGDDDGLPTCPTGGARRRSDGTYSVAAVPRGACGAAGTCGLATKDPCEEGGGEGPLLRWRCRCTGGDWACVANSPTGAMTCGPEEPPPDAL
jgi:hypothetical protein